MNRSSYLVRQCILTVSLICLVSFADASRENPVIGLSLDSLKEERWQRDRDTFVTNAEQAGAKVIVFGAEGDDATQERQIKSFIARKVDVIAIIPHSATAVAPVIALAKQAGIPTISYDRLALDADVDIYLSFDNVRVGELQASYLAKRLPTDRAGRIVRIYGAPTDNNAKLLKVGQDKALDDLIKAGKIEVVHEGWATDWRTDAGKAIMSEALAKAGGPIDGVLASNDSTAAGAVEAIVQAGKSPAQVIITGQDADRAACVRIKAGQQTMTVYKAVDKLAVLAAQVAVELARGETPKATEKINNGLKDVPAIFVEPIAVDKDNIDSTVLADAFHRKRR